MKKMNTISISILALVLLLFLSACTSRPSEYVGKVNNRFITQEEYMVAQRNQFESYVLRTGLPPNDPARREISDRAFNNLVEGIIFQEQLREHRITVNQREVLDTLMTNIPDEILNSRHFQEDGQFDHQKYRSSLLDNDPIDLSWLIEYYSDIYVPMAKLKQRVIDNYKIPDRELQNEYQVYNSAADASIIWIQPESFKDFIIHDREIREYYNEHRADFLAQPHTKLEYIIFPLLPGSADSLATKTKVDSVYAELQDDTPFPILAGIVSDAQTSVNRGEMPFVELNEFPSRIRNALDGLNEEEYTRPFAVQDGWVIYQLMARTRNLVKLREIFIQHKASERTRDQLYERIVNIRELASEIGLPNAAYEYDLQLHSSDIVTPDDPYLPILGKSDRIIERAVNTEPGTIFEPVFHNQLQAYVLISVIESQSLEYRPLHDVYDEIKEIITRERQKELARIIGNTYYKDYNYNRIIQEAEREGFRVFHYDRFNIDTYFPPTDPIHIARAMFITGKDRSVARPIETDEGVFIPVIHRLYQADVRAMTSTDREELRERIVRDQKDELFIDWLKEKIDNARVRDWRHRL